MFQKHLAKKLIIRISGKTNSRINAIVYSLIINRMRGTEMKCRIRLTIGIAYTTLTGTAIIFRLKHSGGR